MITRGNRQPDELVDNQHSKQQRPKSAAEPVDDTNAQPSDVMHLMCPSTTLTAPSSAKTISWCIQVSGQSNCHHPSQRHGYFVASARSMSPSQVLSLYPLTPASASSTCSSHAPTGIVLDDCVGQSCACGSHYQHHLLVGGKQDEEVASALSRYLYTLSCSSRTRLLGLVLRGWLDTLEQQVEEADGGGPLIKQVDIKRSDARD